MKCFRRIRRQIERGIDICLGLFKVPDGSQFDSVAVDRQGNVRGVLVKKSPLLSNWIWGIWAANVRALNLLEKAITMQRLREEKLLGVGFNSLATKQNVVFKAEKLGENYFDVGTMDAVVRVNRVVENFEF